jgi:hypothetical protein
METKVAPADVEQVCRDCGDTFIITAREFDWFAMRDLKTPRRCHHCRRARRLVQQAPRSADWRQDEQR